MLLTTVGTEWENAEQELKEGLASVKAAEKEDQEGLVTALKETIEKYQKMKPIQEMVAAIQASLTGASENRTLVGLLDCCWMCRQNLWKVNQEERRRSRTRCPLIAMTNRYTNLVVSFDSILSDIP